MPEETLIAYLLAVRDREPLRPFTCHPNGARASYADGVTRVASIAGWLAALGIKRGEYIACYLEEPLSSLHFALACAMQGIVYVPLSPVFSAEYFLHGIVHRLGTRNVFTTPRHLPSLTGNGLRILCLESCAGSDAGVEVFDPSSLLEPESARDELASCAESLKSDGIFMVQPTAGSTGSPKLAVRRHRAFTRYAKFVGDAVRDEVGAPECFLMAAALTHAFGLHMLTTALRLQASLAIPSVLDTGLSLAEVRTLDPTILPLLPRVQKALHAQAVQSPTSTAFGPSARVICSAGGAAPREILEGFERQGLRVVEFYGSTEASIVAVTDRQGWRPPFAGRVVPDADVRIAADGELLVKSPGVTKGYIQDEAATQAAFTDGYYRTGDFANVTSDGYLQILGRKCDVFNTPEGTNIHPRRIEEMLERLGPIDQVVLVGDQRPFIAALIVVPRELAPQPPSAATEALDPTLHAGLYRDIEALIVKINASLEPVERVAKVALFVQPFPPEVYSVVSAGKVRRNRAALCRTYEAVIRRLYSSEAGQSPTVGLAWAAADVTRRLEPSLRASEYASGAIVERYSPSAPVDAHFRRVE